MGPVTLDLHSDRQIRLAGRELTCADDMSRETPLAKMGSNNDFCWVVFAAGGRDVLVQRVEDSGVGCCVEIVSCWSVLSEGE